MPDSHVVLDLFSGLGGFSSAFADSDNWAVVEVELEERFDPDIQADIADLSLEELKQGVNETVPRGMGWGDIDVVLASPPCTTFSVASLYHHYRDGHIPETTGAMEGIFLVQHTLRLIRSLDPEFWFVENPRAMFRKFMHRCPGCGLVQFLQPTDEISYGCSECGVCFENGRDVVETVTWCQYGARCMKPTDLAGVHPVSMTFESCQNGDECHESAPRGSQSGTQGKDDPAEKAKIPYGLSEAIREACEADLGTGRRTRAGTEAVLEEGQRGIDEFSPDAASSPSD